MPLLGIQKMFHPGQSKVSRFQMRLEKKVYIHYCMLHFYLKSRARKLFLTLKTTMARVGVASCSGASVGG